MEFLKDWIKNIVYFILFIKLITGLIPNGNMSKYIKLFSGILLMLVLTSPLISLKQIDKKVLYQFFDYDKAIAHESLLVQRDTYSSINESLAIDLYKKKVRSHIYQIVEAEKVEILLLELFINEEKGEKYGEIIGIELKVRPLIEKDHQGVNKIEISSEAKAYNETTEAIIIRKNIKIALHGFYNIPTDNMNIIIEPPYI